VNSGNTLAAALPRRYLQGARKPAGGNTAPRAILGRRAGETGYLLMVAAARSKRAGVAAVVVVVLVIVALALSRSEHIPILPSIGSGCLVHNDQFDVPLTTGQAGIAATIAGVASDHALPVRAVTIAYATALQESNLANLPYGDRDSVGVFQQRPSQGWGTRAELLNPVYATTRFFAALMAIPGYLRLPIYQAAQDVQRSANGSAYSQYAGQGAAMAQGFSGSQARSVWCWYGSDISGRGQLAAAQRALTAAFGPLRARHAGDPVVTVRVRNRAAGWAVSCWLITHAASYRIDTVRFAGYQWTAADGQLGWRPARASRHWQTGRLTVVFG
jgi:hypothetical protein